MRLDRLTLDIEDLDTITRRRFDENGVEITVSRNGTEVVLYMSHEKARELRDVLGLRPVGRAS